MYDSTCELFIGHINADARSQAGRKARDRHPIDRGYAENAERDPRENIEGPGLTRLDEPPQGKQHDQRAGDWKQNMAKHVEFGAMIADHIDWKREICEHVSENDGDGAEGAGKAKVVHWRNSTEQPKAENERNGKDEKHPQRAVRRLVPRVNLAKKLRQQ